MHTPEPANGRPCAQLIELREAKLLRMIDDNCIDIRDIQPRFDYHGAHQDVKFFLRNGNIMCSRSFSFNCPWATAIRIPEQFCAGGRQCVNSHDTVMNKIYWPPRSISRMIAFTEVHLPGNWMISVIIGSLFFGGVSIIEKSRTPIRDMERVLGIGWRLMWEHPPLFLIL